jgi:hyperosmotically inducible periplasmic protein
MPYVGVEEKINMTKQLRTGVLLSAALLAGQFAFAKNHNPTANISRIEQQTRHELVMLPFYSVFDHFKFRVDGSTVTLMGKVSRPILKSDAENVVKKIEGVQTVSNQIEVLPASFYDDNLRLALYRSIYEHSALETLVLRPVPPIHIIVENGNVVLEGAVANEMQKTIAGMQANSVSGVFSVVNNLRVDTKS